MVWNAPSLMMMVVLNLSGCFHVTSAAFAYSSWSKPPTILVNSKSRTMFSDWLSIWLTVASCVAGFFKKKFLGFSNSKSCYHAFFRTSITHTKHLSNLKSDGKRERNKPFRRPPQKRGEFRPSPKVGLIKKFRHKILFIFHDRHDAAN